MKFAIGKSLASVLGVILTLAGTVLMLSPLPGSTIALATGIALLICSNDRAATCLRFLRNRYGRVNRGFEWMEGRAGKTIGNALRRSNPSMMKSPDTGNT